MYDPNYQGLPNNNDPAGSRAPRKKTSLNDVVTQVEQFNQVHCPPQPQSTDGNWP